MNNFKYSLFFLSILYVTSCTSKQENVINFIKYKDDKIFTDEQYLIKLNTDKPVLSIDKDEFIESFEKAISNLNKSDYEKEIMNNTDPMLSYYLLNYYQELFENALELSHFNDLSDENQAYVINEIQNIYNKHLNRLDQSVLQSYQKENIENFNYDVDFLINDSLIFIKNIKEEIVGYELNGNEFIVGKEYVDQLRFISEKKVTFIFNNNFLSLDKCIDGNCPVGQVCVDNLYCSIEMR